MGWFSLGSRIRGSTHTHEHPYTLSPRLRSPVLVHACGRRCMLCGEERQVRRRDLPPLFHGPGYRSPVELGGSYSGISLLEAEWRMRQLVGSCTLLTVRFILTHSRIYLFIYVSYLFLIHYRVCVSELDHLLLLPHPGLPHRFCVR